MKKNASTSRSGLLAAGNWIIDQVKRIDVYPQRGQLANIRGQSQGAGGSPYNISLPPAWSARMILAGSFWRIAAVMALTPGICAQPLWPPLPTPMS
jgi:hypothetical protein